VIQQISISNIPLTCFSLFAAQTNHFQSGLTCIFGLHFIKFYEKTKFILNVFLYLLCFWLQFLILFSFWKLKICSPVLLCYWTSFEILKFFPEFHIALLRCSCSSSCFYHLLCLLKYDSVVSLKLNL